MPSPSGFEHTYQVAESLTITSSQGDTFYRRFQEIMRKHMLLRTCCSGRITIHHIGCIGRYFKKESVTNGKG